MAKYHKNILSGIDNCIKIVQDVTITKGFRRKIMVVITMEVHSRDVVGRLVANKVRKATEFQW